MKQLNRILAVVIFSCIPSFYPFTNVVAQEPLRIQKQELDTHSGIAWGGNQWSQRGYFSKTLEVIDPLIDAVEGRIVIDRDGVPDFNLAMDRRVFLTLWGANASGCFLQLVTHYSPFVSIPLDFIQQKTLRPVRLELGVNKQLLQFDLSQNPELVDIKYQPFEFCEEYAVIGLFNTQCQIGRLHRYFWYSANSVLNIDSQRAALLASASGTVKARVVFEDGGVFLFRIGEGTVNRWKDVFTYGPACLPRAFTSVQSEIIKAQTQPATPASAAPPVASVPYLQALPNSANSSPSGTAQPLLQPAPPMRPAPPPHVEPGILIKEGVASLGNIAGYEVNTDDLKRAIGDLPLLETEKNNKDSGRLEAMIVGYPASVRSEARRVIADALQGKFKGVPNNTRRVVQRYMTFQAGFGIQK